ncbi:interferon-related developmental regulator 2 isoform X3 [Tachyglossus aculeatus]|uniref:interferon-related developmental regulator 2 isoform X3 n=1 Tax=Tachyglossus aculeatus TaxID=9261 RepID=UPI0018F36585|nr:interferon-related developmental regulator 2 isoform X3 [Tachyglossus aculeatus]
MPRARKGHAPGRRGQRRAGGARSNIQPDSPSSDDEAASEALSHYSSTSEVASIVEESPGNDVVDDQAQQEELEEKLKECIDNVTDKSTTTRQVALQSLRLAFLSHVLSDLLLDRCLTLADSLEKCLKKGKGEEQSLAASVLTLLCLQLGSEPEGEELFHRLRPLLISILTDPSASLGARNSCATALGMCCFIAAVEVEAWALLLTICPSSHIQRILRSQLAQLPQLLSSDNVHLRIVAGETIALLFELGRDLEEDFLYEDTDSLCSKLRDLATDSNKYRAKADRRRQRSIIRDVLRFIENGECHEETVKFGMECMYVGSWARRRTYTAFREVLGSGISHHLQNNGLLRDIFSLGPVLVQDAVAIKANKISRFEKHLYNSAAFKARTKARNRVRDKRADVL